MHFQHSADIWRDFPALVPGVLYAEGITPNAEAASDVRELTATLAAEIGAIWPVRPASAVLTPGEPRFTF
jgi:hypothetical protein